MQPLDKPLRNELEKTVKSARDIAENAAKACLEQLGVGETAPFSHLSDDQKDLRRRLRAHGRQLGDYRSAKGEQEITRLVEEVAYEHWHRMLFARFLAENNLLMFDGVAVTLEECAELAADEGFANEWELAANLAGAMLPQIFRTDSVVFKLKLSPEHQRSLERLIVDLPADVFTASDSLGWVYQFWQSKRKEEVNASEVKIGARELPAVTQLFTEPYMVAFLLDNSLGAWWAARRLTEDDLRTAQTEEELREKAAIPGVPLEYLRFVRQDNELWTPAAGSFFAWPQNLDKFKVLDPCCGSGHFLVAAFLMLVPIRMALEGLNAQEAIDRVFNENIHGLELDKRCVEVAAFALAMAAWTYPTAGRYRELPELNIACSSLSASAKKEEWLDLAGNNTNLRFALEELYNQFKDAPILGSLINPEMSLGKGTFFKLEWEEVGPLLAKALAGENNDERTEMGVVAKGISKTASLLSQKYELVITNVPYLALRKQIGNLSDFVKKHYPSTKQNLALVFIERCFVLLNTNGVGAYVCPQDWIFLDIYKEFRKKVLMNNSIHILAKLGTNAFTTQMWDMNIQLISIGRKLSRPDRYFSGLDLSNYVSSDEKLNASKNSSIELIHQNTQLNNPDSRIVFGELSSHALLGERADALMGISTGDGIRFHKYIWEIKPNSTEWEYIQSTVSSHIDYGGRSEAIFWEQEKGEIFRLAESVKHLNHSAQNWQRGRSSWLKKGVVISQMGDLQATLYTGEIYDCNCCAIVPKFEKDLIPLWCYTSSSNFSEDIRKINQSLKVPPKTLLKIGFDIDKWDRISKELLPNGLPKPYSNDPTQWIFHGHPCSSVIWNKETKWTTHGHPRIEANVLQISIARLLGYRWPAELDASMELADEQREWVQSCTALLPYADDDGIVCIPPVRGEASAADRLLNLLAAAYGDVWSSETLNQLLSQAEHAGKTLETWLREKFFTQHCKLFQHRPFIWHIWDGLRDGFAALVNYHKLDYKNLETLTYTYLGDWITRQKQDIANGVDGAAEKLAAAETLKKSLELILEGEKPYDIFVRWKPIDKQPIGWNPDLNDGVRLNIRPFMTVPDVAKKGAGILRDKPNIKWDKDRGKDVESAPWFPVFKGDRINDHHLNLAEKRAARQQPIDNL